MLPPLADLDALSERLGVALVDDHEDPIAPDGVRALAVLTDASALIRQEAGSDWVDDHGDLDFGSLSQGAVAVIESTTLAVAYRAFRNPDGTTQTSVGDVSVTFSRQGTAGALFLTEAEKKAIRRAVGRSTAGALTLVSPWASTESAYVIGVTGGEPILFGQLPGDL